MRDPLPDEEEFEPGALGRRPLLQVVLDLVVIGCVAGLVRQKRALIDQAHAAVAALDEAWAVLRQTSRAPTTARIEVGHGNSMAGRRNMRTLARHRHETRGSTLTGVVPPYRFARLAVEAVGEPNGRATCPGWRSRGSSRPDTDRQAAPCSAGPAIGVSLPWPPAPRGPPTIGTSVTGQHRVVRNCRNSIKVDKRPKPGPPPQFPYPPGSRISAMRGSSPRRSASSTQDRGRAGTRGRRPSGV